MRGHWVGALRMETALRAGFCQPPGSLSSVGSMWLWLLHVLCHVAFFKK